MVSLVHIRSATGVEKALDLFETPATQTSSDRGYWSEFPPTSALSDDGPIEFYISGNGNEYLDLMNTMLYVKAKIVKNDGTPIGVADQNQVAPVNNLLHSLFRQVEVSMNGRAMGYSNSLYPYRALLETVMNYGSGAANGHLRNALFYKDTAGSMDDTDPTRWNLHQLVKGHHDVPTTRLDVEGEPSKIYCLILVG